MESARPAEPAPAAGVAWFRPPPGPDAVVVIHQGAAMIFDTSEDLHRAAAQAYAARFAFDPAARAPQAAPEPTLADRRARRWRRRLRRLRARLADPIVQAVLILLFGLPLVDGLARGFQ